MGVCVNAGILSEILMLTEILGSGSVWVEIEMQ